MSDLINRKDAIDAIEHICPVDTEYDCTLLDRVDVRYVLSDLPSANKWISCSWKLPEMECNVLIWTRSGHYEVAHLDIQEWTEDTLIWYPQYNRLGDGVEWYMEEVLAWQPLPSPYGRRRK